MQKVDVVGGLTPYRNIVIASSLLLLALAFLFLRVGANRDCFVREYVELDGIYSRLRLGKREGTERLWTLIKKYPALGPLVQHTLYQSLILKGELEKAKGVSRELLERAPFMEDPYRTFSATSLLIEEEKWVEALSHSVALAERLKNLPPEGYQKLYTFNLLRINFLEKTLSYPPSCQQELEVLFSDENTALTREVKEELRAHFQTGEISLLEFYSPKRS